MSPLGNSASGPVLGALSHPLPGGMRDLLPAEAEVQGRLAARLLKTFELFGYQGVSLPAFEYAEVLERGLGAIEPGSLLRFVEPDTGEVVALRPDVTPQVARLVSTRLADAPGPARLAYRGSVLRRQHERARHDQQILQAGIELVGSDGLEADLEVIEVTLTALRDAGLSDFVVDLGHGAIAQSLLGGLEAPQRRELLESLALKDGAELARRAERSGLSRELQVAVLSLLGLHGGLQVFPAARAALTGTAALGPVEELERLAQALSAGELSPRLVIDLGETRAVAYYTGPMFQVLAEGPGQAVASGGRYDGLYELFGAPRGAAGAAIHVDHLRWALGPGAVIPRSRILVLGSSPGAMSSVVPVLASLRSHGLRAATVSGTEPLDYAVAWGYSHLVRLAESGTEVMVQHVSPSGGGRIEGVPLDGLVQYLQTPTNA